MAQLGNQNARTKGKSYKDALRYALKHYEDDKVKQGKALKAVALKQVHTAINGSPMESLAATKEIADRLDGKPTQAITGAGGEPIQLVERVIVMQAIDNNEDNISIVEGEIVQDKLEVSNNE